MLKVDRKRAFGAWLWIAVLLYFLTFCVDVMFDLKEPSSNAMMTYLFCGSVTPVFAVSAVLACLPFSTVFIRDWHSGMAVSMQLRCGRRRFLISKILCTLLSGAITLGIGTLLFVLLVNFRLSHDYEYVAPIIAEITYYDISQGFTAVSLARYYASAIALQSLAGMFYASIGLAFSAFIPNTPLTLCAVILSYRVMKEVSFLMPKQWMVPIWLQIGSVSLDGPHTLLAGLGVLGFGALLCCVVFYIRASRRLRFS